MTTNLDVQTIALNADRPRLPAIRKPDTIRHLGKVEIAPLAGIVSRMSEATWANENAVKDNDFACFHHTRHVIFRFPNDVHDPRHFRSFPAWRIWSSRLLPVIEQAILPYGFRESVVPKAMLARVEAGHGIDAHRDRGRGNHVTHKIHVPLQTSPQASFRVGREVFHLAAGEAYEVNNIKLHAVENAGPIDRIHLIFEVFEGTPSDA